jgi:HGF/MSP/plasminogen-like protein
MKGRRQIKSCAAGQRFNPQTNKCDLMAKVKCLTPAEIKKSVAEVEVAPPTPARQDRSGYSQRIAEVADYDYDGINNDPNTPKVECEKYATGLYAHNLDCSKYLNCAHGATYIQDCGRGTVFNAQSKVCDWPRNVNCGSRPNLKAATNADYRGSADYNHGEGIIQARNDFDHLVVENLAAEDTNPKVN